MSQTDYSQFITERIHEGLNFNRNHRFFLLYGKLTADEFLTKSMYRWTLRETLWATLKERKINRVIFYNAADKFFFLDQESAKLAERLGQPDEPPQETGTIRGDRRMQRGPLGNRNVLTRRTRMVAAATQSEPATSGGSIQTAPTPQSEKAQAIDQDHDFFPRFISMTRTRSAGGMSDSAVLNTLNDFVKDGHVRTAIVIEDMEGFLRRFDERIKDQLAARLRDWNALRAENGNVLIFITNRETGDEHGIDVIRSASAEFAEIANLIDVAVGTSQKAAEGFVWYVPAPYEDEIARLINELRLKTQLAVDWKQLGRVVRWLSAENLPLKDLDGFFNEYVSLPHSNDDEISLGLVRRILQQAGVLKRDPDPTPAMERLEQMIGMTEIRVEIRKHINFLQAEAKKRRQNPELRKRSLNLHMVLTGNPGTGKTTVARLVGEIYRDIGLLRRGHTVECGVSDLVAGYVGQTSPKTNARVNDALDGVLFIDEAYALSDSENQFGKEAITTLVARMENERDRVAVIVAGYPEEMKTFISSNPGLSGRFSNRIHLRDYLPEELMQIFEQMVESNGHTLSDEMRDITARLLRRIYELRENKDFFDVGKSGKSGYRNAGEIRNLVDDVLREQADRLQGETLTELTPLDIPKKYRRFLPQAFASMEDQQDRLAGSRGSLSNPEVNDPLAELSGLVGLQPVKEFVKKLVIEQRLAIELRRDLTAAGKTRHMLFTGNPGTGKTTVARLIGRIYRALGLLREGHFVEAQRADLVGQFIGETAQKLNKVLERSLDGVLFIDEAYSLVQDEHDPYGKEAINTLVPALENLRDRLVVIFAGYTNEMQAFIKTNSGLKSRIPYLIEFPDYSPAELMKIFLGMTAKGGQTVPDDVQRLLENQLEDLTADPDQPFDNARDVHNRFYQPMVEALDHRMYQALEAGQDISKFPQNFVAADVPQLAPAGSGIRIPRGGRTYGFQLAEVAADQQGAVPGDIPERLANAVGLIRTDKTNGTGFIVSTQGHLLTSFHVIKGSRSIEFRLTGSAGFAKATYLDGDEEADLAVLKLDGSNWPHVKLATPGYALRRGTSLGVLGYPMGESLGTEVTYTSGPLSARKMKEGVSIVQIDASAYKGNSGGPVFINETGEVIGILSFGPNDTMNFAISIDEFYQRFR